MWTCFECCGCALWVCSKEESKHIPVPRWILRATLGSSVDGPNSISALSILMFCLFFLKLMYLYSLQVVDDWCSIKDWVKELYCLLQLWKCLSWKLGLYSSLVSLWRLLIPVRNILWHRKFRPTSEAYLRQKSILVMEDAVQPRGLVDRRFDLILVFFILVVYCFIQNLLLEYL